MTMAEPRPLPISGDLQDVDTLVGGDAARPQSSRISRSMRPSVFSGRACRPSPRSGARSFEEAQDALVEDVVSIRIDPMAEREVIQLLTTPQET